MATRQLFLYDSYLMEFEARIERVTEDGRVVLDQTAFHPLTGGVACDVGFLVKSDLRFRVVGVEINRETKEISHVLEAKPVGLEQGDVVRGFVDSDRRQRLRRLHTAAHLVATVMYNDHQALVTGGQVDAEYAKLDFNVQRTDRVVFEEAVRKANTEAAKAVKLKVYFLAREEALKMPGVVKLAEKMPPEEKELRMVEIPGVDLQADGGPHVKNTSEIGEIRLLKIENKGKNQRRVYFDLI